MSIPNQISDGDWSLLEPMEGGGIDFPFADKGDHVSWIESVKYRIDRGYFSTRAPMTQRACQLGTGYLVVQGGPRDCGCNLLEWEDKFACVPNSRIEGGTFSFTLQWWQTTIAAQVDPSKYFYDVNYDIEEQNFTMSCEIEYEYFKNVRPDPLIKPRVFLLFGRLQQIGGTPILGNRLVAEDSSVDIWMGKIYVRRTIYVKVTPPAPVT